MLEATTPSLAPEPRLRPRWRVLLLGLIGALALVLPLAQVLLYQVDGLAEDRAALARLDPLAEALAVQRALIDHEAVAALVLLGRRGLEDERRSRQEAVDGHVDALRMALPSRLWLLARREADGLAADWRLLARAVGEQRIEAADSGHRHRLLQEQAVQVMDLVQAHAPVAAVTTAGATPTVLARQSAVLNAHRTRLEERIARQVAARNLAALALVAALGLLTALVLAAARRRQGATPPPPDAVRRSHGRRATDRAAVSPAERAAAELEAVRRSAEDAPSGGG
jgi:hypothetical protein